LIADRLRWRRERAGQSLDVRRQLYADYTAALSRMRTALHECAQADIPAGERPQRVRELFRTERPACRRHHTSGCSLPSAATEDSWHVVHSASKIGLLPEASSRNTQSTKRNTALAAITHALLSA
jgi:hypothetical protein